MKRTWRITVVTGVALVIAVLGFAGAAGAHVTVTPNQASQGEVTTIAFQVPCESDTASTTKLEVQLPADQPLASVMVMPVAGWTATTSTTKLAKPITTDDGDQVTEAVTLITWTANSPDTAIKPGQFLQFPVSLGPLPKSASIALKAIQTYSDASVVRWIDTTTPGQAEPQHPAPVLNLAAAASDPATTTPAGSSTQAAGTSSSSDTGALTVGIIGAVLGLIGAVLGGLAFTRSRRTT
jgi:uncharacterized protein YcnI